VAFFFLAAGFFLPAAGFAFFFFLKVLVFWGRDDYSRSEARAAAGKSTPEKDPGEIKQRLE
jgi:hypothetical protein